MKPSPDAVNIQERMDAFFGILELCHQAGIGGLMADGLSREEAEREWARRRREDYVRETQRLSESSRHHSVAP